MRNTERDERWGAAAGLLGILLLSFIGCTKVLERPVAPASPESDAAQPAVTSSSGYLSEFPTEAPAAGATAPDVAATAPDAGATAAASAPITEFWGSEYNDQIGLKLDRHASKRFNRSVLAAARVFSCG